MCHKSRSSGSEGNASGPSRRLQAEAAAVSETTTTAGGAAATTTGPFGARLALDAGDDDGVTRHVMVGFFDPADGNQAETAAVSQTAATAGGAATTTAGPFGARLALDAGDGVTRPLPLRRCRSYILNAYRHRDPDVLGRLPKGEASRRRSPCHDRRHCGGPFRGRDHSGDGAERESGALPVAAEARAAAIE